MAISKESRLPDRPRVTASIPSDERKPGQQCDLCLLLDDGRQISYRASRPQVFDPQSNEVVRAKLAIDGKIEEGQFSCCSTHFEANMDRPNILWPKRALLPEQNSLVPWISGTRYNGFYDKVSATPPAASPLMGEKKVSQLSHPAPKRKLARPQLNLRQGLDSDVAPCPRMSISPPTGVVLRSLPFA